MKHGRLAAASATVYCTANRMTGILQLLRCLRKQKHYLICYGQLAETAITSNDESPYFYYENAKVGLSLKRQLQKEEIDPVLILMSYHKKIHAQNEL